MTPLLRIIEDMGDEQQDTDHAARLHLAVANFTHHHGKSPDQLGLVGIRDYRPTTFRIDAARR